MFPSPAARMLTLLLLNNAFFSPFWGAKASYIEDAILPSLLNQPRSFCLVSVVQILFLLWGSPA